MIKSTNHSSYLFNIELPQPVIVPVPILTLGYFTSLAFDFLLVRNKDKLSNYVKPIHVYLIIGLYHFMLPIFFASKYNFGNISFMIHPWSIAAQIIFSANSQITAKQWIIKAIKIFTYQDESPTTDTNREIRLKGLKKIGRGISKIIIMRLVLDKLLPKDLSILLTYSVFSLESIYLTCMLALRIYCMVSFSDVLGGIVQSLFLIRLNDTFDSPFLSYSPLDFWNRRWNRPVHHLYRQVLFINVINLCKKKESERKEKSWTDFFSTPAGCGLLVFLISGLMHDFMIGAVARVITFEITLFFIIHGFVVGIEASLKHKKRPTGIKYVICNILTIFFFSITGRLFLNPILSNEEFLKVAQQF